MDELSAEDRQMVARARKLQFFLTQPLHLDEALTGLPGVQVERRETVRGFREIVEGLHDDLPEEAFILVGSIDAAIAKAKRLYG
jgi:F-type H+-transporting ATPase subunit beta